MTTIINSRNLELEINHNLDLIQLNLHDLPPDELIAPRKLTKEQNQRWKSRKNHWYLIGLYLDYLQLKQAGYNPSNPLYSCEINPAFKEVIKLSTRGFLAELNLMISGWDLIKKFATQKKREFPFENPREMLAERCKKLSILQSQASLSEEINQGITLTEVRNDWKNYKRLIHRKFKTSEEEKMALSHLLKSQDWLDFVICAVWEFNTKGEVRKAWNNFKEAFNKEAEMWLKKDYFKKHNLRLISIKWHHGIPVDAKSSRRITFIPLP